MEFHPYAEIFPLIEDSTFDELAEDIKKHGLRESIWVYEGKILDGRNRFMACSMAGVQPKFQEYEGNDPLAFVFSLNVHRRHLNNSQRAMAAAEFSNLSKGRPVINGSIAPISQTDAAELMNVSRESVKRAKKVLDGGSKELKQAVKKGEVAVSKAASVVDLPKSEQLAAATAESFENWQPEDDEAANLEQAEKDYAESIDKVMASDDRLAEAQKEIKRQAAEIASLKLSRNQYQNQCAELIRKIKSLQRQLDKAVKA